MAPGGFKQGVSFTTVLLAMAAYILLFISQDLRFYPCLCRISPLCQTPVGRCLSGMVMNIIVLL